MKFTTPCFVRVEDAEKRKELAVWLSSIGRYVSPAVTSSDYHKDWVIVTEPYDPDLDGYVGIWAKTPKSPAFIDCGENIELFKALAAMNDENYNEQYFVTELAGSSYYFSLFLKYSIISATVALRQVRE